jgi:hypothetical protein
MTPPDVGNGLVSASLGEHGAWLSLGAPHPRHGFVELTALPPFDPAWRGDPAAVRRYRGWMTEDRFWFLRVDVETGCEVGDVVAWADAVEPRVRQRRRLRIPHGRTVVVRARGRLDAHPLAEITEVDPPSPTGAVTHRRAAGERLWLDAPALPARAEIRVTVAGGRPGRWEAADGEARLAIEATGGELELVIDCALDAGIAGAPGDRGARSGARAAGRGGSLYVPALLQGGLERLTRRAVAYVLGCTAVPIGTDEVCLITDHRILPLSWTRDAYYQAALLLAAGGRGLDVVGAHLRWLWGRCERPRGLWMRSHHTNGAVKDPVFQADQQLYPLLELCDYHDATGELPRPVGGGEAAGWWAARVAALWDALPTRGGLLPTAENAADDPASLPYPLSAQILLWATATRLAALAGELGLEFDVDATARSAAASTRELFTVEGPFGRQWAYEVDGCGEHRLYHDANDLPTALAPVLGFCPPCDAAWATTMRFAFSHHNPAYRAGACGGLGSMHTPGTWTLGDVQEWVVASLFGDAGRAGRAVARLLDVARADGLLPEAYDPATGGAPIRPWFAWPSAALGWLLLRHGGGHGVALGPRIMPPVDDPSPWQAGAARP